MNRSTPSSIHTRKNGIGAARPPSPSLGKVGAVRAGAIERVSEFGMSKIWDSLQDVERHLNKLGYNEGVQKQCEPILDRRSTKRLWACVPVLVYGYQAADSCFHEGTEAVYVNARSGLITLSTAVNPGQTLLLMNKVNLKEEKCTVVRQKCTYMDGTAILVDFPQPVPDFWDTTR